MTQNSFKQKMMTQYVYPFAQELSIPPLDKNRLGGKGKNLAEMVSIALPVPPGFIIITDACNAYRKSQRHFPEGLPQEIKRGISLIEKLTQKSFGSTTQPLLVSVRSGARDSMPGMMDTILNLGLNDQTVIGFANQTQNEVLAYDSYRRLIMMYADIVKKVNKRHFEQVLTSLREEENVSLNIELSSTSLKKACVTFKKIYLEQTKEPFPEDVYEQLFNAIAAVFDSWDCERSVLYRHLHHIPDEWGTAVTVQTMVFGNKNHRSATGVGFTRDPASGQKMFYGEFLIDAQGEEVVAGIRTPQPINKYQKTLTNSKLMSLEELMPDVYQQLCDIVQRLEHHYHDMQDIEFTIDDGHLYMLQTRTGKRTGFAAIRMAVEMLEEGLIDEKTALKRVAPDQLPQLLANIFDQKAKKAAANKLVAKGLNAGPGAASGRIALTSAQAVSWKQEGISCILVREEANPDDYPGMVASKGVLTTRGGSTSHAAVVARGMGKPCVVGCGGLTINESAKIITANGLTLKEGDPIAIDGLTGEVFFCDLPTSPSEIVQVLVHQTIQPQDSLIFQYYQKIMALADKYRALKVRTNADTPNDCRIARIFGAEGVGLCRTEHMFMEVNRLNDVRRMFFSLNPEERKEAISQLLPHQKEDFIGIFQEMDGLPVTIRLLDPPLHEFMPHTQEELQTLATLMNVPYQKLSEIHAGLMERNPMLGYRGCRLGVSFPELTAMQVRAIFEAAIEVANQGKKVFPEIMIPLVSLENEFIHQKGIIDKTAEEVFKEKGIRIRYSVGTMIELPRAALIAGEIAKEAEFFSFGTNDLTQTTLGISRDDSSKFVPLYVKGVADPQHEEAVIHLLPDDPFLVIDRQGVGELIQMAVERGRKTRSDLKCGICGEHGGNPSSVTFFQQVGLNYVSCSPYSVPVAKLAAAIANLN